MIHPGSSPIVKEVLCRNGPCIRGYERYQTNYPRHPRIHAPILIEGALKELLKEGSIGTVSLKCTAFLVAFAFEHDRRD